MAKKLRSASARGFIDWADAIAREARALESLDGPCCLVRSRTMVAPLTGLPARRYPLDHFEPLLPAAREASWPKY